MKKVNKFLFVLMALPFVFMSCNSKDIAGQLREEMRNIKNQCPQYQGDGIIMTDANFYEYEKVLEYVCSLDGVEYIDAVTILEMKKSMIEAFNTEMTILEKFSIKTILRDYGYRLRYIYNDMDGKKLCKIEITKYDLK